MSRSIRVAFFPGVLLVPLLAAPLPAEAQASTSLTPGARVRLDLARSGAPAIGTLVAVGPDSISLRPEGSTAMRSFALTGVEGIAVSEGVRSRWRDGALFGGLTGGALGVALGGLVAGGKSLEDGDSGSTIAVWTISGLALGVGVGALLGSRVREERWAELSVPGAGALGLRARLPSLVWGPDRSLEVRLDLEIGAGR